MSFTYPAATTSLNVFGRRRCSKLYLRSAWVSSPSAAASSASEALERPSDAAAVAESDFSEPSAAAAGSVPGAPSVFPPWAGRVVETGAGGDVSGDFPQQASRKTRIGMKIKRPAIA